ncbi:MAG: hypothetical protein WDZ90_01400 [Candidatus Paceibacterota bacterium]
MKRSKNKEATPVASASADSQGRGRKNTEGGFTPTPIPNDNVDILKDSDDPSMTRNQRETSSRIGVSSQSERGFTLLLSVLISSLLLAIGLAIFNITIKELILSSSGRESQFAFYAADTGAECALFHDFQRGAFSTSSPAANLECIDEEWEVTSSSPVPGTYTRTFSIDSEPHCMTVVVTKEEGPPVTTSIEARGYNTCDTGNPRRVERAIRVTY